MTDTIIICTPDEMISMHQRGEIESTGYVIGMNVLFEVMCDHYRISSTWDTNDVY